MTRLISVRTIQVGGLAMEGDYDPDQVAVACEAYFGRHDPVQYARARLFGIAARTRAKLEDPGLGALIAAAGSA